MLAGFKNGFYATLEYSLCRPYLHVLVRICRLRARLTPTCFIHVGHLTHVLPLVRRMRRPALLENLRNPVERVVPIKLGLRSNVLRLGRSNLRLGPFD